MKTTSLCNRGLHSCVGATVFTLLIAARGASADDDASTLPVLEPTFLAAEAKLLLVADSPAKHSPVSDDWMFRLGTYLWLPGLDGEITVNDRTLAASQSTEDVLDLLETTLNFAFAGHFEAEKGRFGLFADFLYVDLSGDRETRRGTTIEIEADASIGELGLFFAAITPDPSARFPFRLDVLGGVRWIDLGLKIDTDQFGSASRDRDWVDPFIGVRGELGLLEWLSIKARGDIGGFGISEGNTSDLVLNVEAAASFKVAKWLHIDLGYRWLDYDYEDGDDFKFDATLNGPYVMLEFRF